MIMVGYFTFFAQHLIFKYIYMFTHEYMDIIYIFNIALFLAGKCCNNFLHDWSSSLLWNSVILPQISWILTLVAVDEDDEQLSPGPRNP